MFGQLFRRRQTALSVCNLKATADAKIVNGQDIRAAKIENEKHFHGPASNTLDLGQSGDDLIVVEKLAISNARNQARVATLRQVNDVCGLWAGKARRSQTVNGSLGDLAGRGEFVVREQPFESFKNCSGNACTPIWINAAWLKSFIPVILNPN